MRGMRRHRARGFSLLEAIVALTVFSICALSLYAWLAVNVDALGRVDASNQRASDGRLALAILETVNPMAELAGERRLPGDVEVRWEGRELVPVETGMGPAGAPLIFDMGLYELDVTVMRQARATTRFTVRRAGWRTARALTDGG